jgi:multiple sugar transport system substrate-binding protein
MVKRFGLLLLAAVLAAGICFAGGKVEQKESPAQSKKEPVTLEVVGHRVHKIVATEGKGGDIIAPWIQQTPGITGINWTTLEIKPIHDRLFREATLPSTDIDVFYIVNTYALPRVANLLEPLNDYLKSKPIPGFEENFGKGMLDTLTFNGKLYGIPMRAATHGLGWNKQIFAERGLTRPPETPEEFYEFAKKLTFTRADGTKVYGYVAHSHYYYTSVCSLARMWDGDFITNDLRVVCNEPGMVNAVALMRRMYAEGILPPDVPSMAHAEKQRLMQAGRAAMAFDVMGKVISYNDPSQTDFGSWTVASYPLAKELKGKYKVGAANTEFWSMVIPKNSKHKDQAWEFIRHLSSPDPALKMALNGNGPTRNSVFLAPEFSKTVFYSEALMEATKVARIPIPAFEKSPQAAEMIDKYIESAMLGYMEPKAAMDELAQKLRELSSELK